MILDEAIAISLKCLISSPECLESEGIDDLVRCEAYNIIREYQYKMGLLYQNKGTTEAVLKSLYSVGG